MQSPANLWNLFLSQYDNPLFKKLRLTIFILIIYSTVVISLEKIFAPIFDKMKISDLGQFHLIFSFVISILIAFRVNSSYARWWEARSHWGVLVNNSRNLALKFNNFIGLQQDPLFLICIKKFPLLLAFHLRRQKDEAHKLMHELGLDFHLDDHIPLILINHMYRQINQYRQMKKVSIEQYLALDIHLTNLVDVVGGCEKITNTPIPAPFKIFVNQALYFYMLIFPFGWVETFGFLIIPIVVIFVYLLQGMEILSKDLESPFCKSQYSHNSTLDLEAISKTIETNISAIDSFRKKPCIH